MICIHCGQPVHPATRADEVWAQQYDGEPVHDSGYWGCYDPAGNMAEAWPAPDASDRLVTPGGDCLHCDIGGIAYPHVYGCPIGARLGLPNDWVTDDDGTAHEP